MKDWLIEQDSGGGTLQHEAPPRFAAQWTTGDDPDELAAIDGPCWSDAGSSGGGDALHIYAFQWRDAPPGQAAFEALMQQAARAIDAWIAARL